MNFLRANFLSLLPLLLMVVASLLLYPDLPDALPGSFDFDGEVQRTSPKLLMVVLMPAGFVGLVLAINLLIRISPHKYSLPNSKRPMDIILFGMGTLMGFIHFALLLNDGDVQLFVFYFSYGMAAFLIIVGNVIEKIERNFFVGLRLPWTLASTVNWRASHRFAAKLMVAGGVILLISNTLYSNLIVTIVIAISTVLIPVLYSLVYFL